MEFAVYLAKTFAFFNLLRSALILIAMAAKPRAAPVNKSILTSL